MYLNVVYALFGAYAVCGYVWWSIVVEIPFTFICVLCLFLQLNHFRFVMHSVTVPMECFFLFIMRSFNRILWLNVFAVRHSLSCLFYSASHVRVCVCAVGIHENVKGLYQQKSESNEPKWKWKFEQSVRKKECVCVPLCVRSVCVIESFRLHEPDEQALWEFPTCDYFTMFPFNFSIGLKTHALEYRLGRRADERWRWVGTKRNQIVFAHGDDKRREILTSHCSATPNFGESLHKTVPHHLLAHFSHTRSTHTARVCHFAPLQRP